MRYFANGYNATLIYGCVSFLQCFYLKCICLVSPHASLFFTKAVNVVHNFSINSMKNTVASVFKCVYFVHPTVPVTTLDLMMGTCGLSCMKQTWSDKHANHGMSTFKWWKNEYRVWLFSSRISVCAYHLNVLGLMDGQDCQCSGLTEEGLSELCCLFGELESTADSPPVCVCVSSNNKAQITHLFCPGRTCCFTHTVYVLYGRGTPRLVKKSDIFICFGNQSTHFSAHNPLAWLCVAPE